MGSQSLKQVNGAGERPASKAKPQQQDAGAKRHHLAEMKHDPKAIKEPLREGVYP